MKITIVTGPFLPTPPGPAGAMERLWFELAPHFARAGHQVTFISRRQEGRPNDEVIDGVRHLRHTRMSATSNFAFNLVKDMTFALRVLPKLPRADICVINDFSLPILASRVKRTAGKVAANINRMPKGQMKLYRPVARFHAASVAIRKAILEQVPDFASRVVVINNPINTSVFRPVDEPPFDALNITYAGRINPEKGLDLLVQAASRVRAQHLPALRLRLIGEHRVERGGAGESYKKDLQQLAEGLDIQWIEAIYERELLANELRRGTLFCYPSIAERGEAMPLAPLEAMGCGRVPVVSNLRQFDDYIRDGHNGIVFDHRASDAVERLASALHTLLADRALNLRLARAASETAAQFSVENIARQYLADFETMLAS